MAYRTGPPGARPVVPPAPALVDLHTHTTRSDGVLEPSVLVGDAAAAGIRRLAITDHDTLAGLPAARAAASEAGVELIAGLEINAVTGRADGFREREIHILGYGVDPESAMLRDILAGQRRRRLERFEHMLRRLSELDMPIDDIVGTRRQDDEDAIGRPTVARALVEKGHATSVEDAFRRWLSHGRPAYVPRVGLDPKGAIDAIVGAGGVAVLAHFGEGPDRPGVVRELRDMGIRGLEVYYRGFWAETVEGLAALAAELRLLPTGGTDYHGDRETYAEAHAELWVPPDVGRAFVDPIA